MLLSQPTALLLTWLLELPVAMVLAPRRDLRLALVVVVASLLTHPCVWWIATHTAADVWWPTICVVEAVVGVVEGLFVAKMARMSVLEGLIVGIAMNGFSFGVGLCL